MTAPHSVLVHKIRFGRFTNNKNLKYFNYCLVVILKQSKFYLTMIFLLIISITAHEFSIWKRVKMLLQIQRGNDSMKGPTLGYAIMTSQ